jgi:hypothetical protein
MHQNRLFRICLFLQRRSDANSRFLEKPPENPLLNGIGNSIRKLIFDGILNEENP